MPNLYLVGSINNKKYFQDLKKLIKKLNLDSKIFFTGKIKHEHMPAVYKQSLMVLFASKIENCPNILFRGDCHEQINFMLKY